MMMRFQQHLLALRERLRALVRHRAAFGARVLLTGLLGAWMMVLLLGEMSAQVGLFTVTGKFAPAVTGRTTVRVPPLGSLSAPTHAGPLHLHLRVDEVNFRQIFRLAGEEVTLGEATEGLRGDVSRFIGQLIARSLVMAALGAFVLGIILRLRARPLLWCTALGLLGVALPLLVAGVSFSRASLGRVAYAGELSQSSTILQAADKGWRSLPNYQRRWPQIEDRLRNLFHNAADLAVHPSGDAHYLRVLHISDTHNNPMGVRFALDVAREYEVDLVLMSGDFTDFGVALEADILAQWGKFTVPVVAVTGNHDSRAIARRLRDLPTVTMLEDGEIATHAGLSVMGFGDPRADREDLGDVTSKPAELRALHQRILARLAEGATPDILLLHDHTAGAKLMGRAPVIAVGHSHTPLLQERRRSVLVNPGTSGASGLRYFTAPEQPGYGAAVLFFTRERAPRLAMVDMIEMDQPGGNFAIRRQMLPTRAKTRVAQAIP